MLGYRFLGSCSTLPFVWVPFERKLVIRPPHIGILRSILIKAQHVIRIRLTFDIESLYKVLWQSERMSCIPNIDVILNSDVPPSFGINE